ncbi:MAG: YdcF family protein [Acetobacteraceae bacterium]|nr:YdcF family protein [Acetobacteraceae bacterium]
MLAVIAGLLALFAAGFAWFVAQATSPAAVPAHADGIVVLTGGAGRIELALRLLAGRHADRLLISGTGRGELADLLAAAGLDARLAAAVPPQHVTLGRGARSTRGNARETADWVAAHDIHSLIVVTSGYHMRRALLELGRTLPATVALYPSPLVPHLPDGQDRVPLRLLAAEYGKWLAALAGLSGWVAREEEGAPAPPAAPRGGG